MLLAGCADFRPLRNLLCVVKRKLRDGCQFREQGETFESCKMTAAHVEYAAVVKTGDKRVLHTTVGKGVDKLTHVRDFDAQFELAVFGDHSGYLFVA